MVRPALTHPSATAHQPKPRATKYSLNHCSNYFVDWLASAHSVFTFLFLVNDYYQIETCFYMK